ncbi:MAG TPA: sulfate adenylyltransferase subunit CysN [Bryobacteraceae bacterium]|nr:sulfate adenylyltransferase subunit CysN [Bryobacteraceae bacterium]
MATLPAAPAFSIEQFLEEERGKDLLRFTTAGSVDDGKSTLIGRLLYDSRNVYEDQVRSVTKASVNRSAGPIDFSLLTDGLRAEREQGITIDVAYRYFATARRKFIIADTPGHEQYTRNMATGASTADLAIILIDARKGVLPQSRRHTFIASLLGIRRLAVAVNKMDLVDYSESVFQEIREAFLAWHPHPEQCYFLPISALEGDNVVERSARMPWFQGPSLLEYLETVETGAQDAAAGQPFRFPVQRVIRPNQDFRGYAGQIASGAIRPGDEVCALPSGRHSRVRSIATFDGDLEEACAPMSVTLTLEDELDLSRGDMLAEAPKPPGAAAHFETRLVWLNQKPLDLKRRYLLKHTAQLVSARISAPQRIDVQTLQSAPAATLEMNDIATVEIETSKPLFFDPYVRNRITGSLVLIDVETNATVAAGMIVRAVAAHASKPSGPVTTAERRARFGHRPATLFVGPRESLAAVLERRLFDRGCMAVWMREATPEGLRALEAAGAIAIATSPEPLDLPESDARAADILIERLFEADQKFEKGGGI